MSPGEQAEEQAEGRPRLGAAEVSGGVFINLITDPINYSHCGDKLLNGGRSSPIPFVSLADVQFPVATDPVIRRASSCRTEGGSPEYICKLYCWQGFLFLLHEEGGQSELNWVSHRELVWPADNNTTLCLQVGCFFLSLVIQSRE